MLLAAVMLAGLLPVNTLAAAGGNNAGTGSTYYKVISEKSWDIAPVSKKPNSF